MTDGLVRSSTNGVVRYEHVQRTFAVSYTHLDVYKRQDKYMLMVHPDDRDSVAKGVTALREGTAGSDPCLLYTSRCV